MAFPTFAPGDVLNASDMNAVGLWLVKSDTIAAASSSHICTGAFSADYNDYLIVVRGVTVASGSVNLIGQLRTGSTTTTANYHWAGSNNNYSTVNAESSGSTSSWRWGTAFTAAGHVLFVWISSPFATVRTAQSNYGVSPISAWTNGGYLADNTSYDQFVISPASSTMDGGTIRVYGMRN